MAIWRRFIFCFLLNSSDFHDHPEPKYGQVMAFYQGKIIVCSGRTTGSGSTYTKNCYTYKPTEGWKQAASLKEYRFIKWESLIVSMMLKNIL